MHVHIPFSTRRKYIIDRMTMEWVLILSMEESQFQEVFLNPDSQSPLSHYKCPLD